MQQRSGYSKGNNSKKGETSSNASTVDPEEESFLEEEYTEIGDDDKYFADDSNNKDLADKFSKMNINEAKFIHPLIFSNNSGFSDKVDSMLKNFNPSTNKKITDTSVNVLMIAEKPSIARLIGDVVSNGHARIKKGARGKILINFDGTFKGVNARYTVSSVAGHVYTSDFLKEHNKWNAIDPSELYDVSTIKLEAMKQAHMPIGLKKLAKGKDIICLWLDCDKEGENICYEVLYNAIPVMNKRNYQQVYRAKFSSLTKKDLKIAFDNLNDVPNKNESLSVDCRQIIDLKIGVSFTRFLTSSILPALDLPQLSNNPNEKKLLSYGPCQTPCLWFCVNRQKQIEKFSPVAYFNPYIEVEINNKPQKLKYGHNIYNESELNNIMSKLKKSKNAKVKNVSTKQSTKDSPEGLNTVTLLKIASPALKMSPHSIMSLAEKLYTMGYITYPRTETTKYSSNFDFISSLKSFENHPIFGQKVKHLLQHFKQPSLSKGTDIGDHPPITPSRIAVPENLERDSWDLYQLICNYYFASISSQIQYENITYSLDVNGVPFEETALSIKEEGFLMFLPEQKGHYQKQFPVLHKGTDIPIKSVNYDKDTTKPPSYLTEADLIKEMDANKIGTDASMAVHIDNISQRGYVKVDNNRQLVPTKLGTALIDALGEVVPEIIHPGNRAKIETLVDDVAHGKRSYQETLKYALGLYKEKFIVVKENYEKLVDAFKKHFNVDVSKLRKEYRMILQQGCKGQGSGIEAKGWDAKNEIGKCEKCGKGMLGFGKEGEGFWKGCSFCKRREKVLDNIVKVDVDRREKCKKCGCFYVIVKGRNPFPNGGIVYSGCLMCDPKLSK